jgi:DNA replication initiation complex subunit (GINS family)
MSTNRSVQAAQRRRAGPTNSEPGIPGRGPQPSINSAQMFANQARPGQGPNISTGRLAGQQAAMQQQQMQQQAQGQRNDKLSSVSKMTLPQAITLITLRLGAIESKLMNTPDGGQGFSFDGESGIDASFLQSIMTRLESLEKRPTVATGSVSSPELNLLKQQFETVKQAAVQSKTSTVHLTKENIALKTQVENLRKELIETKELVTALQNLTMDNNQKILDLSIGKNVEYDCDFTSLRNDSNMEQLVDGMTSSKFTDLADLQDVIEQNEIIGTDLKQLIESELNSDV